MAIGYWLVAWNLGLGIWGLKFGTWNLGLGIWGLGLYKVALD
jgi:hypothetical protein